VLDGHGQKWPTVTVPATLPSEPMIVVLALRPRRPPIAAARWGRAGDRQRGVCRFRI